MVSVEDYVEELLTEASVYNVDYEGIQVADNFDNLDNKHFDNSSDSSLNEDCIEKKNQVDSFAILEDISSDINFSSLNNYFETKKHVDSFTISDRLSDISNDIAEQENISISNDDETENDGSCTFKILKNELKNNSLNSDIFENKTFDLADNEGGQQYCIVDNFPIPDDILNEINSNYSFIENENIDSCYGTLPDYCVDDSSYHRVTDTDNSSNSYDEVINEVNPKGFFTKDENLESSYKTFLDYNVNDSSFDRVSDTNDSSISSYNEAVDNSLSSYNRIALNCVDNSSISYQYEAISSDSSVETVSETENLLNKPFSNNSLNYGLTGKSSDFIKSYNFDPICNEYPIKSSGNSPYKPELDDISSDGSEENASQKENLILPVPETEFPENEERFFFLEKLTLEYKKRISDPNSVTNYDILFNLVKKYRLNHFTISMYPKEYLVTILNQNTYDTSSKLIPIGAYDYTNRRILSAIDSEVVTDEMIVLAKMHKNVQLLYDGYLIVKVQKFIYEDKPTHVDFILLKPMAVPVLSESKSVSEYNDYLQKHSFNMHSQKVKGARLLFENERLLDKAAPLCLDTKANIPCNWTVKPYDIPNENVEEYVRSKLKKPKRIFNPKFISKELFRDLKNDMLISKTHQKLYATESENALINIYSAIKDTLDLFKMVYFEDFELKEENEKRDEIKETEEIDNIVKETIHENRKEEQGNRKEEKMLKIKEKNKEEIKEQIIETMQEAKENKEKQEKERKEKINNKKEETQSEMKQKVENRKEEAQENKKELFKYEELVQPLFPSSLVQQIAIYLFDTRYEYEDVPYWEVPCSAYEADVIEDFICKNYYRENAYRETYKYKRNRRIYLPKKKLKLKMMINRIHDCKKRISEEKLLKEKNKQKKLDDSIQDSNKRMSEDELLVEKNKQRKIYDSIKDSSKRISEEELLKEKNKQRKMDDRMLKNM